MNEGKKNLTTSTGTNVFFFTEKEEEFVNLLIEFGTSKNVAKILVFLAFIAC